MRHLAVACILAVVFTGCSAAVGSPGVNDPTPESGVRTTCQPPGTPPPLLTCGAAVAAVSAALATAGGRVASAEFRYGNYCPARQGCAVPRRDTGHVILELIDAPTIIATVELTDGVVHVAEIATKEALDEGRPRIESRGPGGD